MNFKEYFRLFKISPMIFPLKEKKTEEKYPAVPTAVDPCDCLNSEDAISVLFQMQLKYTAIPSFIGTSPCLKRKDINPWYCI